MTSQELKRRYLLFEKMVQGEMAQIAFVKDFDLAFPNNMTLEDMFNFVEKMDYGMEVRFGPKAIDPQGVPVSQGHTHDPTTVVVTSAEMAKMKEEERAKNQS